VTVLSSNFFAINVKREMVLELAMEVQVISSSQSLLFLIAGLLVAASAQDVAHDLRAFLLRLLITFFISSKSAWYGRV
jgi:hypothetical protein